MSDILLNRNVMVDETSIIAIANALKNKMAISTTIKPINFAAAVNNIGINCSGTANISTIDTTNIVAYASAKINDDNLISDNIKKGETILGINGSPSVINAIGATITGTDVANGQTAYSNNTKITGSQRIYVSNQVLYMPQGWITVSYSAPPIESLSFSGTELYSGNDIGVL